ncbi:oxygenase MpaB family protein [Gordonia malaquae]|uniref:oxygenase MpaB family protein n=1 Tax=Gordonia malaquae TaxID=410332 RepID=UPI003018C4B5
MTLTSQIPRRHPTTPAAVPPGVAAFARLLRISAPDEAQFRRYGEALNEGDPLMDDLVDWMVAVGVKTIRPKFELALERGIAHVDDAPQELRDFFAVVEDTPSWVDHDALRTAGLAMNSSGVDGLYIARDVSLVGGYTFSGFNQTLLRTGALEKGSNTRFAETSQWAIDVISAGGLDRFGAGYRSTLRVRLIHSLVRRHVVAMEDWDSDLNGLPINQTDMAATIVGSLVAPALGGLGIGLFHTPAEYAAIAHLTRYVGWLMGISDEFLPTDFSGAVRLLHHTSAALAVPDGTSKQLARPMADDPLTWNYPRMQAARRRIARSQHLSISTFFLGRGAMRTLGLPTNTLPWYPLVKIPVNLVESALRLLPGGRERSAARGVRAQQRFLSVMEAAPVTIGATTHLAAHAA